MAKTEIDYSTTIIYKITCKDTSITELYVGHTTNFVQRRQAHKHSCMNPKSTNHACKLYAIMREHGGWTNWRMEIVHFFTCNNQCEARIKEQEYFILLNATLNSIEPMPTPKTPIKPFTKPKTHIKILPNVSKTSNGEQGSIKFSCEICDYTTCRQSQYDRHLTTSKHKQRINTPENKHETAKEHSCNCGKKYKHSSSLWNHQQKCTTTSQPINDASNNYIKNTEIVMLLIKENREFKNMIMEVIQINKNKCIS